MAPELAHLAILVQATAAILVAQHGKDEGRGETAAQKLSDVAQDLVLLLLRQGLSRVGERIASPEHKLHIVALLGLHCLYG